VRHLIVGGAGFIGSNLAKRLLGSGEEVTIFDNFSRRGARENIEWLRTENQAFEVVEGDVRTSRVELEEQVAQADAVYHLAAQVAVTTSVRDPRMDFDVNAIGTLNVIEAIRETNRDAVLIYSSTNKVYGALESIPIEEQETRYVYGDGRPGISESVPLDLHSPYGCSKGAGDQYVRDYARIYGLRTVVLRQSCIYGPRQFGIEDQGWLAWFCIAAALGRQVTLYGAGKQVRDLLHVDDLVTLMLRAVERIEIARGEIYNVGGGPPTATSLLEAIGLIEMRLGARLKLRHAAQRPGDQLVYVSDISKVSRELEWQPKTSVELGVADLTAWISTNRDLFDQVGALA
jgi:CDP-paratose 2-epimerase